jgi:TonB family protein
MALAIPLPAYAQVGKGAPDVPFARDLRARAKPQLDPSLWMIEADYPPAARRAEQQGHVGLLLVIDTNGRVADCTILASSGSDFLDRHSCKLVARRARFIPAIGKDRRPARDRWNFGIEWRLPAALPRPEKRIECTDCGSGVVDVFVLYPRDARPRGDPALWLRAADYPAKPTITPGGVEVELTIASRGIATACRVTESSGSRDWDRTLCSILRRRARFDPARNAKGKRVRSTWTHWYSWGPAIAK